MLHLPEARADQDCDLEENIPCCPGVYCFTCVTEGSLNFTHVSLFPLDVCYFPVDVLEPGGDGSCFDFVCAAVSTSTSGANASASLVRECAQCELSAIALPVGA